VIDRGARSAFDAYGATRGASPPSQPSFIKTYHEVKIFDVMADKSGSLTL